MTPYHQQDGITLYHGDCREVLATLPDESAHAVVTDPPYGLSFMGKRWDYDVPSVEVWQQCLRVLKPGGHLLAFAGTRTQHRMAVRIEDAGFEIRDMIAWVYGSGFPKSLDVSKAIDKAAGAEREVVGQRRQRANNQQNSNAAMNTSAGEVELLTVPATPEAQRWQGWGTALKPALEPITVARKPLSGTVAETVLQYGTGALNVDGCRVQCSGESLRGGGIGSQSDGWNRPWKNDPEAMAAHKAKCDANADKAAASGRWPANLIHDGSDEVTALFPIDTGGSAARFFYCAKASKRDRGESNRHPTVKPVDLMRYLIRLVCPVDGLVLDPFAGSGTTLVAAQDEHCRAIGIEREEQYCEFIRDERLKQRRLF